MTMLILRRETPPAQDDDETTFFRAHEFGHLYHHHTRAAALTNATGADADSVLQAAELEADCYAASQLTASHPEALLAAIHFLQQLGDTPRTGDHPSGNRRATVIRSCMMPPSRQDHRIASTNVQ
jgi:hypothetical protein